MPRRYRVVDVFAERRYAGNPLTVVLDADGLSAEDMQAIARETNHSETTFVLGTSPTNGAWPVRVFTPARELPFAGHPVLGTAAVLRDALGATPPVVLDLKAGRVPAETEGGLWWMHQPPPSFGNLAQPAFAARSVNLQPEELDARFMPQAVSTGVPFLIVAVERLASVRRARLSLDRLRGLLPRLDAEAVLVFCAQTEAPDARLHVRCFTEAFGIPEDPATGSANGCLAAYLVEHRYFGGADVDVAVEQGIEIGRPSRLHLRARRTAAGIDVHVGGRVEAVAEGILM